MSLLLVARLVVALKEGKRLWLKEAAKALVSKLHVRLLVEDGELVFNLWYKLMALNVSCF